MSYWEEWHREYDDPSSRLSRRLIVVQRFLRHALDSQPAGQVRLLSLCAGEGRDVTEVLARHARRRDVTGVLVEAAPEIAGRARARITERGLDAHLSVLVGDAGATDTLAGAVPVDVLLLCGVFGNLTDEDVEGTIRSSPRLCAPGAWLLWTRHTKPPDLTVAIRRWLKDTGFDEVAFAAPADDTFGVGLHRLAGSPLPFQPGVRLFRFLERT